MFQNNTPHAKFSGLITERGRQVWTNRSYIYLRISHLKAVVEKISRLLELTTEIQEHLVAMKSYVCLIGIFAFLLTTCLAYRKVAPKKSPFVTDPGNPDSVAPKKHSSLTDLVKPYKKFVKCQSRSDCSPKECCAGVSSTANGTCLPQPQLKEPCDPHILPGAMECSCRTGMTCSTRKTIKIYGKRYGRCVYVTPGPDEIDGDTSLPRLS